MKLRLNINYGTKQITVGDTVIKEGDTISWREGSRIGEPWHWNYVGLINGLNE